MSNTKSLDEILKEAVTLALEKQPILKDEPGGQGVNEAIVASAKPFKQVSETLSQKTKEAHETLYKGYIEKFNEVSAKLDSADRLQAHSSHSLYRSLRLDETMLLNAVYLHELYFANCFSPHSEIYADSYPYMTLEKEFGTFDDWQKDFMACALSAREGWAVCGFNCYTKRYTNTFIDLHDAHVQMGFYPLIVVDMWTHAFHRDYLVDKKSYLITQLQEINWKVVEERFEKCKKIQEALR